MSIHFVSYIEKLLKVKISKNEARFTLLEGENIVFYVKEKEIEITKRGETYVQKI